MPVLTASYLLAGPRKKRGHRAVEKAVYLRLFKNIQMQGERRLQKRGVIQLTPQ
jgi:hypothetical protein